jgi:hypothetical protein
VVALVALVVGLILFFLHAWRWWAQDYIVTNRRIMKVEGVFNKHAADSSLEKINDAVLRQGVIARMLGYGDLDIMTAADSAIDRYRMLAGAAHFKVEMLNRKHALDLKSGAPPTPPVPAPNPVPAAPNCAPGTVAEPATVEADDPRRSRARWRSSPTSATGAPSPWRSTRPRRPNSSGACRPA